MSPRINFCQTQLTQVSVLKYLGIEINEKVNNAARVAERITTTNRAFNAVNNNKTGTNLYAGSTKIQIYKTLVRQILLYGIEAFQLKSFLAEAVREKHNQENVRSLLSHQAIGTELLLAFSLEKISTR